MYTNTDLEFKKSIHYMDPRTKVSRAECLAITKVINQPRVITNYYDY